MELNRAMITDIPIPFILFRIHLQVIAILGASQDVDAGGLVELERSEGLFREEGGGAIREGLCFRCSFGT